MRWNRWEGGVPAAAWLFFASALVRFCLAWWNPETTGVAGMVPNLVLVLAVGLMLGSRMCWATAFVLMGIWVTLLGVSLGMDLLRATQVYAEDVLAFLAAAVQFGLLAVLHPRWNARWAEAPSR